MKNSALMKKVICILLSGMMVTQTGCSATKQSSVEMMEQEEIAKYSLDFIGGSDVMPLMAYYGPDNMIESYNANDRPDYLTDEIFQKMADAGINMMARTSLDFKFNPNKVYKMLELGEKYNIAITVTDSRIKDESTGRVQVKSIEQLDEYLCDYIDYPACAGVFIVDEPGQEGFSVSNPDNPILIKDFKDVYAMFNELDVFAFGNLLPNLTQTREKYELYVQEWVETTNLPYLMFDRYPFDANQGLAFAAPWFETMTVIRQEAEKAGIPFFCSIQAGAQWNDSLQRFDSKGYFPAKGEFMWNVGAALAFGAKGLNYFPLIQPIYFAYAESTLFDFQRNGILGAWGNKTRWYYYAQEMNKQIAAADHVLMNSVNKGVIASGKEANSHLKGNQYLIEGTSWRELSDVTGDALIGCFNYLGKTALYVVNYDTEYAQNITLDFIDTCSVSVIQNAEEKKVTTDSLELTFSPGNSALIVFE